MFTFSNSKLATLITGLALVVAGNVAAANTKIEGVVKSVDYTTNSITVTTDKTGEILTYSFTGTPKVDVNGRKFRDMSIVEPGQSVILKISINNQEKLSGLTKGEILEINREQNIALIRPANGSAPRVIELPENVSVSGLHTGASVEDLQKGHMVTLKYTAR